MVSQIAGGPEHNDRHHHRELCQRRSRTSWIRSPHLSTAFWTSATMARCRGTQKWFPVGNAAKRDRLDLIRSFQRIASNKTTSIFTNALHENMSDAPPAKVCGVDCYSVDTSCLGGAMYRASYAQYPCFRRLLDDAKHRPWYRGLSYSGPVSR